MASKLDLILSEVRDLKKRFDHGDVRLDQMEANIDRTASKLDRMEAKEDTRFEWIKDQFGSVHHELTVIRKQTAHLTERVVAVEDIQRKNCV